MNKMSQKEEKYLRHSGAPPCSDKEIKDRISQDFQLETISTPFWEAIKEQKKDYLDAKVDEGWDAWSSFVREVSPLIKLERLHLESGQQPKHLISRTDPNFAEEHDGPAEGQADDNAGEAEASTTKSSAGHILDCFQHIERLRFFALQTYFLARACELAKAWREKHYGGKTIGIEWHLFLRSPALRLFSLAQINDWGEQANLHLAQVIIDQVIGDRQRLAVVEFPSGLRGEAIFDPSRLSSSPLHPALLENEGTISRRQGLPGSAYEDIVLVADTMSEAFGLTQKSMIRLLLKDERILALDFSMVTGKSALCWPLIRMPRTVPRAVSMTLPFFLSPETVIRAYRFGQHKLFKFSSTPKRGILPPEEHKVSSTEIRNCLLFVFMVEHELTENALAGLLTSERRCLVEKWNSRVAVWPRVLNDLFQLQQSNPGTQAQFPLVGNLLRGVSFNFPFAKTSLWAWSHATSAWQFNDGRGRPDTRRFVEQCKRAEAATLNFSVKRISEMRPFDVDWWALREYENPF